MFRQAERAGTRRVYVGIEGSSTNDGGFGLARALGWAFRDADGVEIKVWTDLDRLEQGEAPPQQLAFDELIIAVDVDNPLLGKCGASRTYGGQKGLMEADLPKAEACLRRLAMKIKAVNKKDVSRNKGTGAAGGLGLGLKVFCGGTFQSGGKILSRLSGLKQRIQKADLVITAEGALDEQTSRGKVVDIVAQAAARTGKHCICLAGSVTADPADVPWPNFRAYAIVPDIAPSEDESKAHRGKYLAWLATHVAREIR